VLHEAIPPRLATGFGHHADENQKRSGALCGDVRFGFTEVAAGFS
jgi:hypothetical protein